MANKLNIPNKDTDKFAEVEFVQNMTPFQLKTLVKNMWENMGELANATDNLYPDVANVIDKIRDGGTWSEKTMKNRYRYTVHNQQIIMFDTRDDKFRIMDTDQNVKELKSMTQKEIQKLFNGR